MSTPAVSIIINEKELSKEYLKQLLSIEVDDEVGVDSDYLRLTFTEADGNLEIPKRGSKITVKIGSDGVESTFGQYSLDEIKIDPERLTLSAKGLEISSELKTKKTRSFGTTNLSKIIEIIAADYGLSPKISEIYRSQELEKKQMQVRISDIMYLNMLAKKYGASFKINGKNLIFMERAAKKTASGTAIDPLEIDIDKTKLQSWVYRIDGREDYGNVIVTYTDINTGEIKKVEVKNVKPRKERDSFDDEDNQQGGTKIIGSSEMAEKDRNKKPPLRITLPVSSEKQAIEEAKNLIKNKNYEVENLTIVLDGDPRLNAESKIIVKNIRDRIDGEWVVMKVRHRIDVEWYTEIDCQRT